MDVAYRWRIVLGSVLFVSSISAFGGAAPRPRTVVKLFEGRPVAVSDPTATLSQPVVFDEHRLLLRCVGRPSAVVSSTSDGTGSVVVDNFFTVNGVNVCTGLEGPDGRSCFQVGFGPTGTPALDAYEPVGPLDVSAAMPTGRNQIVTFRLEDGGGVVANSDLWLVTDCVVHNKVELCHKPGTPAEHTISVGSASVDAHLAHGDYIGTCS